MRANPHTHDVNFDWGDRVLALRVEVDQEKARALGVSSQSVARSTAAVISGVPLGLYRENDRLIDVVLRAPAAERGTLEALAETQRAHRQRARRAARAGGDDQHARWRSRSSGAARAN